MSDIKIPPGFRLNKLGCLVKSHENLDPVPKASKVAFKRPLSATERVKHAIRQHEASKALNALPGDDTFDEPDVESMTPHQLMEDPATGEELTAGEYVMLQHERALAKKDIAEVARRNKAKQSFEQSPVGTKRKTERKKGLPAPRVNDEDDDVILKESSE